MLENLLSRWKGKLFVLVLLGFAAISFIIKITLSAADAAAHIAENPFVLAHFPLLNHRILVTLILLTALGAIFLKGFKEAIGIAVFLVAAYLLLNVIVISVGLYQIFTHPVSFSNWRAAIFQGYGNPLMMIGAALIVFPKLALGLSGFETGVVVMPHVRGDRDLTVDELESLHTTRGPRAFMPTKFSARWKKIPSVGRLFMLVAEKLLCVFCVSGRAQRPSSQRYSTVAVSLQ